MARTKMMVSYDKTRSAWRLKGAGQDGKQFETKRDAVKRGASAARKQGNAQLVIKGKGGRIQEERTYGSDPRRTKG